MLQSSTMENVTSCPEFEILKGMNTGWKRANDSASPQVLIQR